MIETLLTKLETLSELRSRVHKQAKDNYLCFLLTYFHHFKTSHTDDRGEPGYSFRWAQCRLPRLTAPPCLCEEGRVWRFESRSKSKSRRKPPFVREKAGMHTVKTKEKKDPILTSCMSTYMPTARLEDQTVFSSLCVPLLPMCGEAHHFFPALAPGFQHFLWLSYKHPFPSPSGHAIAYVHAIHIPHLIQKGIVGRPAYVA